MRTGGFLGSTSGSAVRQSVGLTFRLADAGEDASILTDATQDAREVLSTDPILAVYPHLQQQGSAMFP